MYPVRELFERRGNRLSGSYLCDIPLFVILILILVVLIGLVDCISGDFLTGRCWLSYLLFRSSLISTSLYFIFNHTNMR